MDGGGFHSDGAEGEKSLLMCPVAEEAFVFRGEKRTDHGCCVVCQFLRGSLGKNLPASCSCFRAQLDQPVGMGENLGVMIHQHHRVAVCHQIVHHTGKSLQIGGMKPD